MLHFVSLTMVAFFAPTARLPDGKQVSFYGRGPPVVFSSGLFGMMPRRLYTRLFRNLKQRATLVVLDDVAPVTAQVVSDVADTLGVDAVGFFSHSSIDASILDSPRVHRAVICDPVVLPEVDMTGLTPVSASGTVPTLVLRAGMAYDDVAGSVGIPEIISPSFDAPVIEETYEGVGHADMLDDTWAELGPRVLPWMRGVSTPTTTVPFAEWSSLPDAMRGAREARATYRDWIANQTLAHLLSNDTTKK